MRISDWSSDVCSSDLATPTRRRPAPRRRSRWRPNRCRRARRAQEGCCDKAGCCSSSDCSRAGPYSPSMDMPDTPAAELRPTLDRLRTAWQRNRPDARQRMDDLARLRDAFQAGREAMLTAISADFGHRSAPETLLSDAMTVSAEIEHLREIGRAHV